MTTPGPVEADGGPPGASLVRSLELDIMLGRFKPRERLVEDALMARFDAKRHVVRRALDELQRLGVVVREKNRGAAVRDFSTEEVEDVYELRELLQHAAAERLPLPGDAAFLAALVETQRRHDAAVAANDLRAVDEVNDRFHATLFSACGNRQLAGAIAHYAQLGRAIRGYLMADPVALARLRDEHWAMIRAIETGDRDALLRLVRQHIQPSKAAYLRVRRAMDDL